MKVFMLAGQSNAAGRGDISELPEARRLPDPRILYHVQCSFGADKGPPFSEGGTYSSDGWTSLEPCRKHPSTPGRHFGPEMGLGPALLEFVDEERVAIIKHGRGGTGLHTDWNPDAADGPRCYAAMLHQIVDALDELKALDSTPELAGFFWFQGESDSLSTENASAYESRLEQFIARLRRDLNAPALPFVAAQIRSGGDLHPRTGAPWMVHSHRVQRALADVAEADGQGACVPTADLGTRDQAHLDGGGLLETGRRMAAAWAELAG